MKRRIPGGGQRADSTAHVERFGPARCSCQLVAAAVPGSCIRCKAAPTPWLLHSPDTSSRSPRLWRLLQPVERDTRPGNCAGVERQRGACQRAPCKRVRSGPSPSRRRSPRTAVSAQPSSATIWSRRRRCSRERGPDDQILQGVNGETPPPGPKSVPYRATSRTLSRADSQTAEQSNPPPRGRGRRSNSTASTCRKSRFLSLSTAAACPPNLVRWRALELVLGAAPRAGRFKSRRWDGAGRGSRQPRAWKGGTLRSSPESLYQRASTPTVASRPPSASRSITRLASRSAESATATGWCRARARESSRRPPQPFRGWGTGDTRSATWSFPT